MRFSNGLVKRMGIKSLSIVIASLFVVCASGPKATVSAQGGPRYEISVTNLTRGQQFTPILFASHGAGTQLFELGSAASSELETLAEEGDTGPLTSSLLATPGVQQVMTAPGLLNPGDTRTVTLSTRGKIDYFSIAAMLIPTNDAFFAVNGIEGPRGNGSLTLFVPAYDAGTERNDELCASIPGPNFAECGGPGGGGAPGGGEEGYVHIHAGIHGIGDLVTANRDWRNPVAKVTIRRIP